MTMERRELSIDALTVDSMQARETPWVGDTTDQQLAASVDRQGLLHDLIVRPITDNTTAGDSAAPPKYRIIAGARRYYAALEAGEETIACKIVKTSDLGAAWTSLKENTDRRELSEGEIAQQLRIIYETVRPQTPPSTCPACGQSVKGERGLLNHIESSTCELPQDPVKCARERSADASEFTRFATDAQAKVYIAERYLGRNDEDARQIIRGHLRTASLPPTLQALFKQPEQRTEQEQMALSNYNIDQAMTLGSGNGYSGTAREVTSLYEALDEELAADQDNIAPRDAVLEAVGSFTRAEVSEQELRRTLRAFRRDVVTAVDADASGAQQRAVVIETLQEHADQLREIHEDIEPTRPFKKVDVMGPDSQRHSRWHVRVMQQRETSTHSALVKALYEERLETLAEQHGWQ